MPKSSTGYACYFIPWDCGRQWQLGTEKGIGHLEGRATAMLFLWNTQKGMNIDSKYQNCKKATNHALEGHGK